MRVREAGTRWNHTRCGAPCCPSLLTREELKVPYPKCKEQEEPILALSLHSRLQLYTIQSRLFRTSNKEQHNQGEVMFEESRKESS